MLMCFRWTSTRHGQALSMLVKLSHTLNQNEIVLNKVLYKQCSGIFLEDTLHQSPMVTLQCTQDKPRYSCALQYFYSTYFTTVSYSQTSKIFQGICRATAHPQKQLQTTTISVASEVTTATYNDFILVFPPAPK